MLMDTREQKLPFPTLTPDDAAELIYHRQIIGFSGFTPAGAVKAIPPAIAKRAIQEHEAGRPFKIGVITGASTGASLDGELAKAEAVLWRTPYQSDPDLRELINRGEAGFFDMHLSMVSQSIRYGFLGKLDWAIIEAADVTADGEIVLSTSVGCSPTFCSQARKIIIEINKRHTPKLRGLHDIYEPADPPHRREVPIYSVRDRIGSEVIKVDPAKIVGIVYTDAEDESKPFREPDRITRRIGDNVAEFLAAELQAGRIPKEFLPIQSGVGNIANAVLSAIGDHPDIPEFEMYTEVIQDSVIDLMAKGKISFVSGTSLTLSPEKLQFVYDNLDEFRERIILRPQEISNNPEVARRIGVISINTALECDILGNVNSTHVLGKDLMNGIGGSGDFTRNAYISIFCCPSVAKKGKISTVVPHCSHIDHSEHSVQVIVTEQGCANLRCLDPKMRALSIINKCANPVYRDDLQGYYDSSIGGYTPETLGLAFAMHQKYLETGDMRDVDWGILSRISTMLRSAKELSQPPFIVKSAREFQHTKPETDG